MKYLLKNPGKFAICMMFLATLAAFSACSDDDDEPAPASGPPANEVWMQSSKFTPATRTVNVNTTVKWVNKDGFNHNVISDDTLFDSGIIPAGGTYSRTFADTGTFPYTCTLHSNMTGTIIVQ